MSKTISFLMAAFLAALLTGCGAGLAPKQENPSDSRWFYHIGNWPYQRNTLFSRGPAEFAAGLISLPFVILGTPIFVDYKAEEIEIAPAIVESEKEFMRTPGYVIYMGVGCPFYLMETGGRYCYAHTISDTIRGQPVIIDTAVETDSDDDEDTAVTDEKITGRGPDVRREDTVGVEEAEGENTGEDVFEANPDEDLGSIIGDVSGGMREAGEKAAEKKKADAAP